MPNVINKSGKAISPLDLFAHRCSSCGHVNVYGFWHQLERRGLVEVTGYRITVRMECQRCDHIHLPEYELVYTPEDGIELGFDPIALGM